MLMNALWSSIHYTDLHIILGTHQAIKYPRALCLDI